MPSGAGGGGGRVSDNHGRRRYGSLGQGPEAWRPACTVTRWGLSLVSPRTSLFSRLSWRHLAAVGRDLGSGSECQLYP